MNPRIPKFDKVSNLLLLDNNLHHVGFELSRRRPSFFRVAREAHLALLRTMIEALRGTANLEVVVPRNKKRNKNRATQYQVENGQWKQVQRVAVPGCQKAWRFSDPTPCSPPALVPRSQPSNVANQTPPDEILIGFYELLAMIQADCFMIRSHGSISAQINDEELRLLEWLHENVRNEFEHYIPKLYWVGTPSLIAASHLALRITQWLLRDSHTIHSIPPGIRTRAARLTKAVYRHVMQF